MSEGAQAVSGEPAVARAPRRVHQAETVRPSTRGPAPGDLRLVIEQDDGTGEYIYKTVRAAALRRDD
ncbi:hypothetical protein ACRAWD_15760 [Caulobacter segnis]